MLLFSNIKKYLLESNIYFNHIIHHTNNIVINNSCPYLGVIYNIINGYAYVVPMKVGRIAVLLFSQLYGSSIGIGSMVYVREDNRLTTETTGNPVGIISGDYYGIGRLISFF